MSKLLQNIKDPKLIDVEIISIGDELLIGQTVNTNASWMGEQLSKIGANVARCVVIKDDYDEMCLAFMSAFERSDIVLVTGGLGPTEDDFTKQVLCDFFETELVQNEDVLKHVTDIFSHNNREMLEVNRLQAMVPESAEVLFNAQGTAPGMLFTDELGKILISMPGVPYEMRYVMTEHVLPRLASDYDMKSLYYETIQSQGIGESYIADRIQGIENSIRSEGLGLAYLPSPGGVRLRLSGLPSEKELIQKYVKQLSDFLPQYVFGYGDDTLSEVVGKLLKNKGLTLGTVESCTGGAIASAITSVSGSSNYFEGSIVSYSEKVKMDLVNVPQEIIEEHGVVSLEVVEEMAKNGRDILKTDYCISISGYAGSSDDLDEDSVGVICIAIAGNERVLSKRFKFEKDRSRNIRRSVLTALNLLRCELLKINVEKS